VAYRKALYRLSPGSGKGMNIPASLVGKPAQIHSVTALLTCSVICWESIPGLPGRRQPPPSLNVILQICNSG